MEITKLSCSDIILGYECEKKLFFKLMQPKPEKTPVYFFIGGTFHDTLYQNFIHKAKTRKDIHWERLEAIFENLFIKNNVNVDFSKIPVESAKEKCRNYLRLYYNRRCIFLMPKGERFLEMFGGFYINNGTDRIYITYKIDFVDYSETIIDFKTSTKKWDKSKLQNDVQSQIYYSAMKSRRFEIRGFQYEVVTEKEVEVFPVEYSEQRVQEIFQHCFELQRNFKDNNLLPTKKKYICKWCDYFSICEHSKRT